MTYEHKTDCVVESKSNHQEVSKTKIVDNLSFLYKYEEKISMVVHLSVSFSIPLLDHPFEKVESGVVSNLNRFITNLQEPSSKNFGKPFSDGEVSVVLKDTSPLVILAGITFTHSNLVGCLKSAESTCNVVGNYLEKKL